MYDDVKEDERYFKKTCCVCKKLFFSTPEWVYKKRVRTKTIYYCSWTCYRKTEKAQEEKYGKGKCKCNHCGKVKSVLDMFNFNMCWECRDKKIHDIQCKKRKRRKEKDNAVR